MNATLLLESGLTYMVEISDEQVLLLCCQNIMHYKIIIIHIKSNFQAARLPLLCIVQMLLYSCSSVCCTILSLLPRSIRNLQIEHSLVCDERDRLTQELKRTPELIEKALADLKEQREPPYGSRHLLL